MPYLPQGSLKSGHPDIQVLETLFPLFRDQVGLKDCLIAAFKGLEGIECLPYDGTCAVFMSTDLPGYSLASKVVVD